jgi:hypothetical protein
MRVHYRTIGKDNVIGRERCAVLPAHASAQMVHDRRTVGTDAAVTQRRLFSRELRNETVFVIVVEEVSGPKHREVDVDLLIADLDVERVGL